MPTTARLSPAVPLVAAMFVALLATTPAKAERETLGVHGGWAAFRDDDPKRCYAIAAPQTRTRGAYAAVANWPERRVAGQVHFRFQRPARPGSAVVLTVDDKLFQLAARGADAWAPTAGADRAIVAAMRTGVGMTVRTRDVNGVAMAFGYALNGAATAIDSAALACRPER